MAKFFISGLQKLPVEPGAEECDAEPYRHWLPRSYALEPSVATGDAQRYEAGLTQKLFVLQ